MHLQKIPLAAARKMDWRRVDIGEEGAGWYGKQQRGESWTRTEVMETERRGSF